MRVAIFSFVLVSVVGFGNRPQAHAQAQYYLEPESRLWIEGRASIKPYTCEAGEINGFGVLAGGQMLHTRAQAPDSQAQVEVVLPVRHFDCGKKRMNSDMYEALKAAAHPTIAYVLDQVDVLPAPDEARGFYRLRVRGRLAIAGVEQVIEMEVLGMEQAEGTYRVQGRKDLLMSDYGIDPPQAMLGLIKADDEIVVGFDLVARSVMLPAME